MLSGVQVIKGKIILIESDPKGKENWFELARGLSYRGFELSGVDCRIKKMWSDRNKIAPGEKRFQTKKFADKFLLFIC